MGRVWKPGEFEAELQSEAAAFCAGQEFLAVVILALCPDGKGSASIRAIGETGSEEHKASLNSVKEALRKLLEELS